MPTFDIIKKAEPKQTFRVASVMGKFDLQSNKIEERFTGSIDMPDEWQIGMIIGKSGSGKTTIAKQLFSESYFQSFVWGKNSILDDMPEGSSVEQITRMFNSVGFSSPPSWLKTYDVLSNGEKMRVDLARALLSNTELLVFDEFTSVVDRQIAQIGSFAVQKAIRKTKKQFIAVSCHYDIEDWLLPDWVFDTNDMTFRLCEGQKKNRPEIKCEIRKSKSWSEIKQVWRFFSRHHYLRKDINQNVNSFYLYVNNQIIGIIAYMTFPHPKIKNAKKISRIVILPEYQGLGLSSIFQEIVGDFLLGNGYRFIGGTSHPKIVEYRKKSKKWICSRVGRISKGSTKSTYKSKIKTENTSKNATNTSNKITTSWEYIGGNHAKS